MPARLQAIRAALGLSPRKRNRKRVYPTAAQAAECQALARAAIESSAENNRSEAGGGAAREGLGGPIAGVC